MQLDHTTPMYDALIAEYKERDIDVEHARTRTLWNYPDALAQFQANKAKGKPGIQRARKKS